jgi:DNA-binding CsgD family transcriptional regulator
MELLERDGELAELDTVLAAAAEGLGSVVLISGEAGIGKTRLVAEFAERNRDDARVLWGSCDDLSTPRTLGPFRDIAGQTGGDLRASFAAGADRADVLDAALGELLGSRRLPTVIVIEDAHWADTATLDMLKFLGRRIATSSSVLVITYRVEEVAADHPLRMVVGDVDAAHVHRLSPAPLSRRAVEMLAGEYPGSVERLVTTTMGNPFLVAEMVTAADDDVPANVQDAVRARAARLSDEARDLAELAAVIPGTAPRWLLQAAGGIDEYALEECRDRRLLEADLESVWYRHELVRGAVEGSLGSGRRRRLNQAVLDALVEREADLARIVHHAREAADRDVISRYAPRAARQASAAASHREALAHYRLAVSTLDLVAAPEAQAQLLGEYAIECYFTNEAVEGMRAANESLRRWRELGDAIKQGEMLRWLSRLNWWLGRGDEAEATGREAVAVLEGCSASHELAMAYSNLAQIAMLAQRYEPTVEWANRAIDLARELDDHDTLAHALNNLGSARLRVGDTEARALLRESLELSLREGLDDHAGRAYANLIWTELDYREYAAAEQLIAEGLAYATDRELAGSIYYITAERARLAFETGRWSLAESDAEWVLRRPEEPGITRLPALTVLARLGVRRGDQDAAGTLERAWAWAEPTGELQRIAPLAAGRAELAWLAGDPASAAVAVDGAVARAHRAGQQWVTDELAFWSWRSGGDPGTLRDSTTPYGLQAGGDWRAAAAAWEEIGCPYEQALALADGDVSEPLLGALAILDGMGARPLAALVRRKLRRMGVSGVPRGPRPRTRAHPAGLTPRQVEVLQLVAAGMTNAEIADHLYVSAKTVDHHVSAILTKLGASSRTEAAAMATEAGYV